MSKTLTLFACLVGINRYTQSPLHGCLNDVSRVEAFIRLRYPNAQIHVLLDEQATKKAIVHEFLTYLSRAQQGDSVLFYFSGHGTQEDASPLWKDPGNVLECIVCYDLGTDPAEYLLADKELRYLIHKVASGGAHVATIFDCCHSGGNTRNAAHLDAGFSKEKQIIKRISRTFPERNWKNFVFSAEIQQPATGTLLETFLPQGKHIQLAACHSDESAIELNAEGVFTKIFLNVVSKAPGLSYTALMSRIRQYMVTVYKQQPQIYAFDAGGIIQHHPFLNEDATASSLIGEAIRNEAGTWHINLGAIHGIEKKQNVTLVDPRQPGQKITLPINEVYVDYSRIDSNGATLTNDVYSVETRTNGEKLISLHLANTDGNPVDLKRMVEELLNRLPMNLVFQDDENLADYTLHIRYGEAYLTYPHDPFRPLNNPIALDNDASSANLIEEMLRQVARYKFLLDLANTTTSLPQTPLTVEIFSLAGNTTHPIASTDKKAVLHYTRDEKSTAWSGQVKVKITNITQRQLFICALYMDNAFGVNAGFLPGKIISLAAGQSTFLEYDESDIIPLIPEPVMFDYNWPSLSHYLRFIVSTTSFSVEGLELAPIPSPPVLGMRGKELKGFKQNTVDTLPVEDWSMQTVTLDFINPVFNKVTDDNLNAMLKNDDMNYFALGLYFDIRQDDFLQPATLQVKEGITILPSEGQRNIFGTLKINLANKIERAQRNRRYERVKNSRIRIVAEGDSWFQYPILVKDILDHLSSFFAIRSLAAAGDTLRNYMIKNEFIDAINTEKPTFFLLSGGGNDILGEQFRTFLNHPAPSNPKDFSEYLNSTLNEELTSLMEIYRNMFNILSAYPDLWIIVHGYDYVIPLDTTLLENKKKTSWLGKYMLEKGIASQENRRALIRYILDEFNTRLATVASGFTNVHYIDARNTVKIERYWYDEIHPTDEGFQDIAMKFLEFINSKTLLQPKAAP